MAEVVVTMSMSLDGFIEDSREGVADVFAWAASGEVTSTVSGDDRKLSTSSASADIAEQAIDLGLLDPIAVDLEPALLDSGTPFLTGLQLTSVLVETRFVAEGHAVTHPRYRARRAG